MRKRIFAMLLAASMFVAMMPVGASAACNHTSLSAFCKNTDAGYGAPGSHYTTVHGVCEYGVQMSYTYYGCNNCDYKYISNLTHSCKQFHTACSGTVNICGI